MNGFIASRASYMALSILCCPSSLFDPLFSQAFDVPGCLYQPNAANKLNKQIETSAFDSSPQAGTG
jgi:hypothetical protein